MIPPPFNYSSDNLQRWKNFIFAGEIKLFRVARFYFRASSPPRVVENIGRVYAKKQENFRCGHTSIPPISTNFSVSQTSFPYLKLFP